MDPGDKLDIAEMNFDEPFVVPNCYQGQAILEKQSVRLNFLVFKAAFNKQKPRREFRPVGNASAHRAQMLMELGPEPSTRVLEGNPSINTLQLFGYNADMQNIGTDVNSAGSIRVIAAKSNDYLLMCSPFASLQQAVTKFKDLDTPATMNHIISTLRVIQDTELDKLISSGARFFYKVVSEKAVVYIPPGFVVCEKCLNGPVLGMIASLVYKSPESIKNASALADLVTPQMKILQGPSGHAVKLLLEMSQTLQDKPSGPPTAVKAPSKVPPQLPSPVSSPTAKSKAASSAQAPPLQLQLPSTPGASAKAPASSPTAKSKAASSAQAPPLMPSPTGPGGASAMDAQLEEEAAAAGGPPGVVAKDSDKAKKIQSKDKDKEKDKEKHKEKEKSKLKDQKGGDKGEKRGRSHERERSRDRKRCRRHSPL